MFGKKKREEFISFSETDSNGVFREAYGYFEERNSGFHNRAVSDDFWKKLCTPDIPKDVCEPSAHDFVRFDEITGGIIYECKKCGLKAIDPVLSGDFDKAFLGSYVEGSSFVWHHDCMDASKIVKISLSFGNYPIRNITCEKNQITYKNSINGSRDGWMTHPKGFFDKHTIRLKEEQQDVLRCILRDANIDTWKTSPIIFDNIGACGFCLSNTFECVFENGCSFICYSPYEFAGFKTITDLFSEFCGFSSVVEDKEQCEFVVPMPQKIKAIKTSCCNTTVPEGQSYCPKCGNKIEDKITLVCFDIDYDPDQTSWICECFNTNACEYQYCSNCGKKRPF